MREEYPAEGGVRLRRSCDDGQCAAGSGRLFVCARCGCAVVVCRCCDRGQIYCNGDCSAQARRRTVHCAGRRWQQSRRGRRMHAARMARYRAKPANECADVAVALSAEGDAGRFASLDGKPHHVGFVRPSRSHRHPTCACQESYAAGRPPRNDDSDERRSQRSRRAATCWDPQASAPAPTRAGGLGCER